MNKISEEIQEKKVLRNLKKECYEENKKLTQLINFYHNKYKSLLSKQMNIEKQAKIINLPSIKKNKSIKIIHQNNKIKKENQHEILSKLKIQHDEAKKKEAIELHEKMKILNENLKLFKKNILLENKKKKNIVIIQKTIAKENIINLKQQRNNLINDLKKIEIDNVKNNNKIKKNELEIWKKKLRQINLKKNFIKIVSNNNNHNYSSENTNNNINNSNINNYYKTKNRSNSFFITTYKKHIL